MKKLYKRLIVIGFIGFIVLLYFLLQAKNEWQRNYKDSVSSTEYQLYTVATPDFDYYNPDIQGTINYLLSISSNEEEYTRNVGEWIYYNIRYDFTLTEDPVALNNHCMLSPASSIFRLKRGVCVTMAKLSVALLRGGGIMSRPTTGCIRSITCEPLQESFGAFQMFEDPDKNLRQPIIAPIRELNGRYLYSGGLHAWTEVYLPKYGWIILEPTTGLMIELNCQDFDKDRNPNTVLGLCNTRDVEFVENCRVF